LGGRPQAARGNQGNQVSVTENFDARVCFGHAAVFVQPRGEPRAAKELFGIGRGLKKKTGVLDPKNRGIQQKFQLEISRVASCHRSETEFYPKVSIRAAKPGSNYKTVFARLRRLDRAVRIVSPAEHSGDNRPDRNIFFVPDIQNSVFEVRVAGALDRAGRNGDCAFLPIDRE
jgi:hypothetical protein